jgi:hypothetical protein
MRTLILGHVALLLGACDKPRAAVPEHLVEVQARGDDQWPLADAEVSIDGRPVGVTDEDGRLSLVLRRPDGAVVTLTAQCPPGYRGGEQKRTLALHQTRALGGPSRVPIQTTVECRPEMRKAAILVRSAPHIPVMVVGREVARTDATGVAHIALPLVPHSSVRLTLDTSQEPRLRPESPSRAFSMADADEMFVFEQPLELTPLPRKKRRPPPPPPPRPVQIFGTQKMPLP